ncbi:hypothetical protein PFICI_02365 [Pestalotiopsis fici W106-1]|uniref:Heterokaryon incompatibility domain-containing protein n=1 Tax=Pestalotiopsis fici (strain W106-1 / CGMCC3.15140) TaxID=1229662 RepID=W3XE69_PESFW|nr:uncharacterized protein PFICI_02365 [Pestalotiopsis fici W106-1]ETS84340.1 hypothetical protein PFICI_02365 [Pestalotiopsis fici W106-1]
MRLLHVHSFEFASGFQERTLDNAQDRLWHSLGGTSRPKPRYAILSHRWVGKEITFQDFSTLTKDRLRDVPLQHPAALGVQSQSADVEEQSSLYKIARACKQAQQLVSMDTPPIEHIWIDTVCINKADQSELSTAIGSMFRWYAEAVVCYAYLVDVSWDGSDASRRQFLNSEWFRRGWTLQELLAPAQVEFYDRDWNLIGSRTELAADISLATNISEDILRLHGSFRDASLGQKMSWLSLRTTQHIEDRAYCMLGIFNVYLDARYGQGPAEFLRLQHEILRTWNRDTPFDETLFAWRSSEIASSGLFAPAPVCFRDAGSITFDTGLARPRGSKEKLGAKGFELTEAGLSIQRPWSWNIYPLITWPLTFGLILFIMPIYYCFHYKKITTRMRLNAWTQGDDGKVRSIELSMELLPGKTWRRVECGLFYPSNGLTISSRRLRALTTYGEVKIPNVVNYYDVVSDEFLQQDSLSHSPLLSDVELPLLSSWDNGEV